MIATTSQRKLFADVANPIRVDITSRPRKRNAPSRSGSSPSADSSSSSTRHEETGGPVGDADASRLPKRSRMAPLEPPAAANLTARHTTTGRVSPPVTPVERTPPTSPVSPESSSSLSSSASGLSARAEKDAEKMGYLSELNRMREQHPSIAPIRQFTMRDAHRDIELEYNRQKILLDTSQSVEFMSSGLQMALTGLEILNDRFGPWLELDGFSKSHAASPDKFKPALRRIYKRIWRRGTCNPWIELLFLLGGGILMHHFKRKLTGGVTAPSNPAAAHPFNLNNFQPTRDHNVAAPAPSNPTPTHPFDLNNSRPTRDHNAAAPPPQRVMRRPSGPAATPANVQPPPLTSSLSNLMQLATAASGPAVTNMFNGENVGAVPPPVREVVVPKSRRRLVGTNTDFSVVRDDATLLLDEASETSESVGN